MYTFTEQELYFIILIHYIDYKDYDTTYKIKQIYDKIF